MNNNEATELEVFESHESEKSETLKSSLNGENVNLKRSLQSRRNLVYYFKCFFDLGYLFMLIPFRFKLGKSSKNYKDTYRFQIHTNRAHQICCGIFHAFIVYELIAVIRLIPDWKELNEKRINILHSGNLIACLIYSISLIYMFWFKQEKFINIFEQLQNEGKIFDTHSLNTGYWDTIKVKVFCYGICLMGYAVAMTHPIIHDGFIFPDNPTESFYNRMEMEAKACFMMSNPRSLMTNDGNGVYEFFGTIFTFIHIILIIPSTILTHMLDLFALLVTVCCWRVVNHFFDFCRQYEKSSLVGDSFEDATVVILSKYWDLKEFIKTVNDGTGIVFLCCIGISLPFYASWTAVQMFEEKIDWFETIHFYVYFTTFIGVLTLAACINKKANEFYAWISTSKISENISPNKMTSLMIDVYANRIALSGCGVFVLTFRFLVTILSVIITYTSIILQFQIGRNNSEISLNQSSIGIH